MKTALWMLALVFVSASMPSASAQTTIYTTSASFLSTLQPGFYTENFSSTDPIGDNVSSLNFPEGNGQFTFTYTISTPDTLYGRGDIGFISTSTPNQVLTITFTSGNINAVGANFFLTNLSDTFQQSPVTINLSNGTSTTYTPTSLTDYRGFAVSTGTIASITMPAPPTGPVPFLNTIDNLTVGITAVPEPSSLAFAGLAVVGIAFVRSRRFVGTAAKELTKSVS